MHNPLVFIFISSRMVKFYFNWCQNDSFYLWNPLSSLREKGMSVSAVLHVISQDRKHCHHLKTDDHWLLLTDKICGEFIFLENYNCTLTEGFLVPSWVTSVWNKLILWTPTEQNFLPAIQKINNLIEEWISNDLGD